MRAMRLPGARISRPSAQAASPPWAAGQMRPRSLPRAWTAAGSTPATGETRASSDSSPRSEEHTSELQSLMRISYAVFCLKKKTHHRDCHHTDDKSHSRQETNGRGAERV